MARKVRFDSSLETEPTADEAITLFRITAEALTNSRKHADAHNVTVSVLDSQGGIALTVADDGIGMDNTSQIVPGHLGVASMRERAERAGGSFEISSAPGAGTTVRVLDPARRLLARDALVLRSAPRGSADRLEQLAHRPVLQHVRDRTGRHHVIPRRVVVESRKCDDTRFEAATSDLDRGDRTAALGHADVEHRDVGLVFDTELEGLLGVATRPDEFDVALLGEEPRRARR